MNRTTLSFVYLCCSMASNVNPCRLAQEPATLPAFEVASIKRTDPDLEKKRFWVHIHADGVSYWSMTPVQLIAYAYDMEPYEISGGPDWINTYRYDIEAKFSEEAQVKDEHKMLQALLTDRFHLAFHLERKPLNVYVLVVDKHGSKLQPATPAQPIPKNDPASESAGDESVHKPARSSIVKNTDGSSTIDLGTSGTQTVKFDKEIWAMHYERSRISMAELSERLSSCLGGGLQKVVDNTGIEGFYQVAWDCPTPRYTPTKGVGDVPSDPEDYSALTRSLSLVGLRIQKQKSLQDFLLLDNLQKPSDNE